MNQFRRQKYSLTNVNSVLFPLNLVIQLKANTLITDQIIVNSSKVKLIFYVLMHKVQGCHPRSVSIGDRVAKFDEISYRCFKDHVHVKSLVNNIGMIFEYKQ